MNCTSSANASTFACFLQAPIGTYHQNFQGIAVKQLLQLKHK